MAEKQSRLVCVDLDGGLVECMCGSLCNIVCQQQDFFIQYKQPVEGLCEGDNMGGSGEVEDRACCSVLDELSGLKGVCPPRESRQPRQEMTKLERRAGHSLQRGKGLMLYL